MKIIDCHCHIYPDKIAEAASKATGEFYGIDVAHHGKLSELLSLSSEANISHHIIFSVATTPKQVKSINNFICQSVEEGNGKFTGLGTLHPDSEDLEGDIEQIIELGLKGVKLHPDIQKFKIDDYRCLKIYELCEGRLPILLHTGDNRYDYSNPNRLKPILETYTELTVIGAHFGGWSVWNEAADKLSCFDNFMVDTSSSLSWLSEDNAVEIIKKYGADKVMFGVDYPVFSPKTELQKVMNLPLTQDEKSKILYKNAANLFKIEI